MLSFQRDCVIMTYILKPNKTKTNYIMLSEMHNLPSPFPTNPRGYSL